ncbi:myo-inosose-2 dehydratase [Silvanigrella sp.]|jgi:inosose dehydratase|uniref:myo-inosose-2 dehydratase n=1 Tax=Silvanigrella sp. TaxID=2024976 RepID=UPI0037CA85C3
MSKIRLGMNPITWSNDDDPSLGGHTPLTTCLEETKKAGFSGTELGGKFPRKPNELKNILAEFDLELVSGWFDGHIAERNVEAEFDAIMPHLYLLKELNAKVVVYADVSYRKRDWLFKPISECPKLKTNEWEIYGNKITKLANLIKDFGLNMSFHHHMGTIVETDKEIDLLMENTGSSVGLLLDTGHCVFSGGNPKELVVKYAKRINHVQCKDVRKSKLEKIILNHSSFMDSIYNGIFTVPGDGFIDFTDILSVLAAQNYQGWLVVEAEQDPNKAHPLTYAKMGYQNLKKYALQAGLLVAN